MRFTAHAMTRAVALLVIPHEPAQRARVGIGVRYAMRSSLRAGEERHRDRESDPDTRLAPGEAPAG